MLRKPYQYVSYRPSYQLKNKPEPNLPTYHDPTKRKSSYLDYYRSGIEQPITHKLHHYSSADKKLVSSKSITKTKDPYDLSDERRRKMYSIDAAACMPSSSPATPLGTTSSGMISQNARDSDNQALRKRLQAKIEQLKRKNKSEGRHLDHNNSKGRTFEKTVIKRQSKAEENMGLNGLYARIQETIAHTHQQEQQWEQERHRLEEEIEGLTKRLLKYEMRMMI